MSLPYYSFQKEIYKLVYYCEAFITAIWALYLIGEFTAGKPVLWHAGASSISLTGIQLAKAVGTSAIYVTSGWTKKLSSTRNLAVQKPSITKAKTRRRRY
jgi:NADPH:quinone reductase-like Zn-dependent oxidoreductase